MPGLWMAPPGSDGEWFYPWVQRAILILGIVSYPSVMLGVPYYRLFYTGALEDEPYHIGLAMALRLDKEIFLPHLKIEIQPSTIEQKPKQTGAF